MKVFLTGAGGFLGSAILSLAIRDGRQICPLFRQSSGIPHLGLGGGVHPVVGDLRQPGPWQDELAHVNAAIHCAATAAGDLPTQLAGTVLATENLLASLPPNLTRFVHVSSFSVYDFSAPGLSGRLDETTALEDRPLRRDAYTQAKLLQERLVRDHCRAKGISLVVVRPGAIFRTLQDWQSGRAVRLGPLDLIFAPMGSMRLVHVDDCARAILAALDTDLSSELVVNVVGDEPITHWGLHRRARRSGIETGVAVPVPYIAVRLAGAAARLASIVFFKGRARLPELLDPPRQQARWRPLRYSNRRAKSLLGWSPQGLSRDVPAAAE